MEGFIEVLREMEIRVGFVCWFNTSQQAEEYFGKSAEGTDINRMLKFEIISRKTGLGFIITEK